MSVYTAHSHVQGAGWGGGGGDDGGGARMIDMRLFSFPFFCLVGGFMDCFMYSCSISRTVTAARTRFLLRKKIVEEYLFSIGFNLIHGCH